MFPRSAFVAEQGAKNLERFFRETRQQVWWSCSPPEVSGNVRLANRTYGGDALRLEMVARGAWTNVEQMPGRP